MTHTMKNLFRLASLTLTMAALVGLGESSALAAVRTWSGGGANGGWILTGNWVGGVAPVGGDSMVFTSGSTTNLTTTCDFYAGGGAQLGGITVNGNLSGDLTITNYDDTHYLCQSSGGIDMSAANHDLSIKGKYVVRGVNQTWNVASDRTLSFSGTFIVYDSITITKSGGGTLVLGGGSGDSVNELGLTAVLIQGGTVQLAKASASAVHAMNNFGSLDTGAMVQYTGTGDYQLFPAWMNTITGGTLDLNGKNQASTGGSLIVSTSFGVSTSKLSNSASSTTSSFEFNTTLNAALEVNTVGNLSMGGNIPAAPALRRPAVPR